MISMIQQWNGSAHSNVEGIDQENFWSHKLNLHDLNDLQDIFGRFTYFSSWFLWYLYIFALFKL